MIFIILMAIFMLWVFFNNDDGIRKRYKNGWYNCKHFYECSLKKDIINSIINSTIITFFVFCTSYIYCNLFTSTSFPNI